MAVQMEKNEILCRGSHLPKLWGLTPAHPAPACRHTFQEVVQAPMADRAWRFGAIVATARTLATFQSRNDQKLGTTLNVEGIRMKAVQ